MNWIKKHWQSIPAEPKKVREFAYLLPVFLSILGLISCFRHRELPKILLTFVIVTALCAVVRWRGMAVVYKVWMFVAAGISWVMTRFVLAVFFYLVLTPISLTMRAFGKDLLDEKIDKTSASYWKERNVTKEASTYERMY